MSTGHNPPDSQLSVLLGTDTTTGEPVYLPYDVRDRGVAFVAKPGEGKSTTLEHAIFKDLEVGIAGMVIDPHGILAHRLMLYASEEKAKRIILLEPDPDHPFGLNLLDVRKPVNDKDRPVPRAVDGVVSTIKKLYGEADEFLPRFERYLRLTARTLIPSRGTLVDIPELFDDLSFREDCLKQIPDPIEERQLRRSWARYDRLRPSEQENHIDSLLNRLDDLITDPLTRQILGSRETTVPFDQILNGNSLLLVNLSGDVISQHRGDVLGATLLPALADRLFARNLVGGLQPRVHITVDEFQRFATATSVELIEQGRKYNAGLTIAHQTLQQIKDECARDAARIAGTLIAGTLTRPDADNLAGEYPINPKPEWTEKIVEEVGTEPVLVPTSEPAEDLYLRKHSDPDLDMAARSFFKMPKPPWPPPEPPLPIPAWVRRDASGWPIWTKSHPRPLPEEPRVIPKSENVPPRPGGRPVRSEAQLEPYPVNDFLYRAMVGESPDSAREFFGALIILYRSWLFLKDDFDRDEDFVRNQLFGWLLYEIDFGKPVRAKDVAATRLRVNDVILFQWLRERKRGLPFTVDIDIVRQRVRWLWVLWDGLRKQHNSLLMPSGQQQPRTNYRYIPHGAQTYADAREEKAARLVDPPQRYIAHVRLPGSYHQVKLRPPIEEEEGGIGATADPTQPDDIRTRSRRLWDTSTREGEVIPLVRPDEPRPRKITRRPCRESEQDFVSSEPERVVEESVPLELPRQPQETEEQPRRRTFLALKATSQGTRAHRESERFRDAAVVEDSAPVDDDDTMEG